MTGSLQIKGGKYYAVLNFKDENGKRRPKWFSTGLVVKDNKRKAEAVLTKLKSEYAGKDTIRQKDVLFIDYMYQWLETKSISIEPNTYTSYLDIIRHHIEPYFREKKTTLFNLTSQDIQEFYDRQIKSGVSADCVLKQHSNIHTALQQAVRTGKIPFNPVSAGRVTRPKKIKFIPNFYTAEQVNTLFKAIGNDTIYTAVMLTALYGFRRSELLGLKWKHIDFINDSLLVQDVVVRNGNVNSLDKTRTKNKASHRTLPLAPVKEYLQELKNEQDEIRKFLGNGYINNDYVCKRENGEPFKPNYISSRFHKLIVKHKLPHIRFHDLRHSAASMLLANGYSLKEIQEWLGHSNLATTADIYAHLQFQAKKDMADSLGSQLEIGKRKQNTKLC